MGSRRDLEHALRDAAEALRVLAETGCEEEERHDQGGPYRPDCFGSSGELSRLGRALLEAVEVVREAATQRLEIESDHAPERYCQPQCDAPGPPAPPLPPYPPYPPYAPHAPFPPYPPYPPVVVIGGSGCGCACQQAAPQAVMPTPAGAPTPGVTPPAVPPVVPPPPVPAPPPPGVPSPIVSITVSSASAASFPDPASFGDVEALLDIGESVAALVRRTIPAAPEGAGP